MPLKVTSVLCPVLCYGDEFAVHGGLCHNVSDGDGVCIKISAIPFQPYHLAAPQSVEARCDYRKFQWIAPKEPEQLLKFVFAVCASGKGIFLRVFHTVSGIGVDQPDLIGILQTLTDICMPVDYRFGGELLLQNLILVIILNDLRVIFQILERKVLRLKIWDNAALDSVFIAAIGGKFNAAIFRISSY